MMSKEIWKPVVGYEDTYEVSNLGRIRNIRYLSGTECSGYRRVNLSKDGIVSSIFVHRIVAEAFIPNPENKPTVNHINEIKDDNRVENLEWATHLEQCHHGTRIARQVANTDWAKRTQNMDYKSIVEKHDYSSPNMCNRMAIRVFRDGEEVGVFDSQIDAARQCRVSNSAVSSCISGKMKSCKGYSFERIEVQNIINPKRAEKMKEQIQDKA